MSLKSGALPGGTRKAVSLSQEPGHLLHNLPAYVAGLHGKLAYKRAGHLQKLGVSTIIDGGRRLTSLDFIAFVILFKDLVQKLLSPWMLVIQRSSMEPWELHHRFKVQQRRQQCALICCPLLRYFVKIVVLLKQHVPVDTLRHFTMAMSYGAPQNMFVLSWAPQEPAASEAHRTVEVEGAERKH